MSGIVHKPATVHACSPGWTWTPSKGDGEIPAPFPGAHYGTPPKVHDYPKGTVWECACGITWVSRGPQPAPANWRYGPGMAPPLWKRESRWARRRRERRQAAV